MSRNARIVGGEMMFEDRDLVRLMDEQKRDVLWREIAFIPQSAMNALDPVYRVGDQIREVLVERGGLQGAPDGGARIDELFRIVGLDPGRQHDYPHQFSGGMRQRVGIALALALNPKLLIADEPVTALDVIVQRQVLDTLRDLQPRLGLSIVLVTHDISVVAYVCDRVVVMYAGQVIEVGPVAEVLARPFHPYTMGLTNAFPDLERAPRRDRADPRCAARPARAAAGLPLRRALPVRDRALPATTRRSTQVAERSRAACWRAAEAETCVSRAREAATWQPSST